MSETFDYFDVINISGDVSINNKGEIKKGCNVISDNNILNIKYLKNNNIKITAVENSIIEKGAIVSMNLNNLNINNNINFSSLNYRLGENCKFSIFYISENSTLRISKRFLDNNYITFYMADNSYIIIQGEIHLKFVEISSNSKNATIIGDNCTADKILISGKYYIKNNIKTIKIDYFNSLDDENLPPPPYEEDNLPFSQYEEKLLPSSYEKNKWIRFKNFFKNIF